MPEEVAWGVSDEGSDRIPLTGCASFVALGLPVDSFRITLGSAMFSLSEARGEDSPELKGWTTGDLSRECWLVSGFKANMGLFLGAGMGAGGSFAGGGMMEEDCCDLIPLRGGTDAAVNGFDSSFFALLVCMHVAGHSVAQKSIFPGA